MCDCKENRDEAADDNKNIPETVTLFTKCPKSYRPGKDILAQSVCDADLIKNEWKPVQYLHSDSSSTICDALHQSVASPISSTESSRTYKFVTPRECECLGEHEEEEVQLSPVCYRPCEEEDEVEREPDVECTLAIIKPEAMVYRKQIERRIFEEGFEIYRTRWLQLTPEQTSEFYSDQFGQLNFAHLVAYMSSAPIIVHVLAKRHAVEEWKVLMGPTKVVEARLYFPDSIRARFGRRGEDFKNAVHGSNSQEEAEKEIHFFFPECIIEPLLKNEAAVDYLEEIVNPILVEALSLCCKLKPADPVLWLANWLILNNPNKPKLPEDLALIPT